jgi:hypothetical protein
LRTLPSTRTPIPADQNNLKKLEKPKQYFAGRYSQGLVIAPRTLPQPPWGARQSGRGGGAGLDIADLSAALEFISSNLNLRGAAMFRVEIEFRAGDREVSLERLATLFLKELLRFAQDEIRPAPIQEQVKAPVTTCRNTSENGQEGTGTSGCEPQTGCILARRQRADY